MARMALIVNGVVTNFLEINPAQVADFAGNGVEIVDFEPLDVQLDDEYYDGEFWRNGEKLSMPEDPHVPSEPTEGLSEDAIAALELMGVQVYE